MNKHSRSMRILELSLRRNHPPTAELLANHLQRSLEDDLNISTTSDMSMPEFDTSFRECSDLVPTLPESDAQLEELLPATLPNQQPWCSGDYSAHGSLPSTISAPILATTFPISTTPPRSISPIPTIYQPQNASPISNAPFMYAVGLPISTVLITPVSPSPTVLFTPAFTLPTTTSPPALTLPTTASPPALTLPTTASPPALNLPMPSSSPASPLPTTSASSPSTSSPRATVKQPANANISLKRKRMRDGWEQTKNTKKRENGEQYVGRTLNKETGKYSKVTKDKKSIGVRCSCKSGRFRCQQITDDQRGDIFKEIWGISWAEKKVFVRTVVDAVVPVERKSLSETRQYSFLYFLNVSGQRVRVCKQMFLNTTQLKETWVRTTLTKATPVVVELPADSSSPSEQQISTECRQILLEFLSSIPKLPSHYRRKQSKKIYLETTFQKFAEFYREYLSFCNTNGHKHVGRTVFMEELKKQNIAIFKPRNDRCDYCISFDNGLVGEAEFMAHREKELKARASMQEDTSYAQSHVRQMVITIDLQAVLLCPKLNASALYYKTKLCVHNFTIYNNVTKDATCYVWNETEGGVSANEFASCVIDYLERHLGDFDSCVIFSDGCTYQNRNKIMAKALSCFCQEHSKEVTQKILERGHTQMPVDSVHRVIEDKLKNRHIYCPADYTRYMQEARQNPKPYDVICLDFHFFKNFNDVSTLMSVRPGQRAGDANVTDIRQLQYNSNGDICYKLDFQSDSQWTPIPIKRNESTRTIQQPSPLHTERLKIKASKYRDLQSLKNVIPTDFHAFYDSLPY